MKSIKPSIWSKNSAPYGTYEGEHGNSDQWKKMFNFVWDKTFASSIIQEESPYMILHILPDATQDQIKKAFRKLMMINHPDKGGSEEICKKIIAAYVILKN